MAKVDKWRIPKKVELRNITITIEPNGDDHYLFAYGAETVKTAVGKQEIDHDFKKRAKILYHGEKKNGLGYPVRFSFTGSAMKTLHLFLKCHKWNTPIVIDFYGENSSEMLDRHDMKLETVIVRDSENTVLLQDNYEVGGQYRPFTPWWGNFEYTDYENREAVEI